MTRTKHKTDILHVPAPEIVEVDISDLPNPLRDLGVAGTNLREIPEMEGKTVSERIRSAWGIDNLLPLVESAPLTENFADRNLVELERDPGTGEFTRIVDGNRRLCCYHLLAEMYADGHEVVREVQGPKGGVRREKFQKNYSVLTVKVYPLLSEDQFLHLQKRDVIARRGLGKTEFYTMAFAALDNFPRISEKELLLQIGAEVAAAAFPNHKKGGAWRETLQNIRRVWLMPRFVRDQFMRKITDTDKTNTKPTGGDVRSLNGLWKQVMAEDKSGVLNNSISTVKALEEQLDLATNGARAKCAAFLGKWKEIMAQNGKKGKGKSSASKSAPDVDAAADNLKQAGSPMGSCLLKWQRNLEGCGSEAAFSVIRDYLVAADGALKAQSPEDYKKLYQKLNAVLG